MATDARSRHARLFQIKNEATGKCIDADNNHLTPGGLITPQACQAVNNQFWMLFQ